VKPEERDQGLLLYIQESIERVERYSAHGEDAFLSEGMVQDATLRRLETLGDAANRLSDSLKARHPEIRWRDIYGFRNIAAHDYIGLKLERVWIIVAEHLPALKAAVESELSRFEPWQGPSEAGRAG
jgi:uncharacterized protein with HEPN domain